MSAVISRSGRARVTRAGERVLAIAYFSWALRRQLQTNFKEKFVSARRRNQHAERVRYPEISLQRFNALTNP
jgi:hypothetical protein